MAELLDIVVKGGMALLATWLGLVVLTRAPRHSGARIFGVLTACLVGWSVAVLIQRLSVHPELVNRPLRAVEDVTASLLPALVLHISLSLAVEGRRSSLQQAALALAYAACVAVGVGAALFPDQRVAITPPHLELPWVSGVALGWAWVAGRVLILAAALSWIGQGLVRTSRDDARRRVLRLALATVSVAAVGAILRYVPATSQGAPWLGDSILGLAMVLAAYGIFSQGVFLGADVAGYASRYSVVVGLGVTLYVTALIALDQLAGQVLGVELPIVTSLGLVATLALFEPITAWARRTVRGRSSREAAYDRLLRALGRDVLTAQRPEAVVVPALARLSQTFQLLGAVVETGEGTPIARHGRPVPNSPLAFQLPLRSEEDDLGSVTFGPKRSLLPFTREETDLLSQGAAYLAASLQLARRNDLAAEALESLSAENVAVEARGGVLKEALVEVERAGSGLQVFALGPLRVERNGAPLRHWGGAKAGTRHAEGLFAFLFDQGERGAAKDEVIELIWPDVDLERADLAFHRTLGGLRTTLEPGRRGGNRGGAITFHNDRYRLDESLVAWSDVRAFDDAMAASAVPDPDEAVHHLERARALYRGDYLDDCPFYGDSARAEERRSVLLGRYVDLLLALGERYERRGDRPAAAASFREARRASGEPLPGVDAALARLSASI
jgi:DNA-binding SARP family transcriptional activator